MAKNKVLITMIKAADGGVASMVEFVIDMLRKRNYQITIAYYEPYSLNPELSVSVPKLLRGATPKTQQQTFKGCNAIAVGCWLPEFEFTQYWSTQHWKKIIDQHQLHISVSGSCLAALAYTQQKIPFMAWTATDWHGDRAHRVSTFPWYRRLFDRLFVVSKSQKLEAEIIASDNVVALSQHTRSALNMAANVSDDAILSMPIDTEMFCPLLQTNNEKPVANKKPLRIGFIGRFEDPRKNIAMFLRSAAIVVQSYPDLEIFLIGDNLSDKNRLLISTLNIQANINVVEYVERETLPAMIQSFDVFVLPSYQEGLCIAALEAMSCAIPIVSTRCGGPQDYLQDNENGLFCDFSAESMSQAILQLLSDEPKRVRYAKRARQTVEENYSLASVEKQFWTLFDDIFEQTA